MSGDDEISNNGSLCVFISNGFCYHFWMRKSAKVSHKAIALKKYLLLSREKSANEYSYFSVGSMLTEYLW